MNRTFTAQAESEPNMHGTRFAWTDLRLPFLQSVKTMT